MKLLVLLFLYFVYCKADCRCAPGTIVCTYGSDQYSLDAVSYCFAEATTLIWLGPTCVENVPLYVDCYDVVCPNW